MLRKVLLCVAMVLFIGGSQAYGSSSVHRWGTELNTWREEGASAVTDSPVYGNGVRLSAWEYGEGDNYEFAIAYAEYQFSVPFWARSMAVTVAYSGNDGKWGAGTAGRLWVKRVSSVEGDSFELPESKKSQSVKLSVRGYNDNGWMTFRVVVEGSQEVDVNYVNIRFYTSAYRARIVTRHYAKYNWHPWYCYTYRYHYPGRHLRWDPYLGCWVRYTYPHYSRYWASRHNHYTSYLRGYYNGRRDERRWQARHGGRHYIGHWSSGYTTARKDYRAYSKDGRRPRKSMEKIRSVLSGHKSRNKHSAEEKTTVQVSTIIRQKSKTGNLSGREQAQQWLADNKDISAAPSMSGGRTTVYSTKETTTKTRHSRTGTSTGSGSDGKRRATDTRVSSGSSSYRSTTQMAPARRTTTTTSSRGSAVKTRRGDVRVHTSGMSSERSSKRPSTTTHVKQRNQKTTRQTRQGQDDDDDDNSKQSKQRSSNTGRGKFIRRR